MHTNSQLEREPLGKDRLRSTHAPASHYRAPQLLQLAVTSLSISPLASPPPPPPAPPPSRPTLCQNIVAFPRRWVGEMGVGVLRCVAFPVFVRRLRLRTWVWLVAYLRARVPGVLTRGKKHVCRCVPLLGEATCWGWERGQEGGREGCREGGRDDTRRVRK